MTSESLSMSQSSAQDSSSVCAGCVASQLLSLLSLFRSCVLFLNTVCCINHAQVAQRMATNAEAVPEAAERTEESDVVQHLRAQIASQEEKLQQQAEEIKQLRAQRGGAHCSFL